jgi:hypothetical protein
LPGKFRSLPGSVFPLYHVLADVGEFVGGAIVTITSNEPLRVDGLAVRKEGKTRVLLANFTSQHQQVTIHNLSEKVLVRHLDETNVEAAMLAPEEFREHSGEPMETSDSSVKLDLLPYAVVRIDNIKD